MSFQVHVTSGAANDVRSIVQWLSVRTVAGRDAWFREWQSLLRRLSERPNAYGEVPESEDHAELIRQAIFRTRRGRPYRALFIARGRDVFVLHVRSPGQDLVPNSEIRTTG